jgi:hypothetical protein
LKIELLKERLGDIALFVRIFFTVQSESLKMGFNIGNPRAAIQINRLTNAKGGAGGAGGSVGVLGIIAAGVGGTFGFLFLLIIGGQIGGSSGIYGNLPASNITAITGNIGKAVVTGSAFVVLIYLGAGVAIAAAMIFLALHVFQRGR